MLTSRRRAVLPALALLLSFLVIAPPAGAAPASADLQKLVRASTFEVVMRKPEKDTLTYEKPLPLELLPYTERNDKYLSMGTAFAIGPNLFVSAGHVMRGGVGSQYGTPSLRDAQGSVYPVDRIVKFSFQEDFVVFTVINPPQAIALSPNTQPVIDDAVYAVGNALGDGVVIRDGLLTSMTPEDQDGRWKWLRFSAAASPGNSGGPLLDDAGQVLGIVIARSQGENLNYALPINRVLDDAGKVASIDLRTSFVLPVLRGADVSLYKDSFPLPQTFTEFSKRMLASHRDYEKRERERTLAAHAAELFPRGESAKLLAEYDRPRHPSIVVQAEDRSWEASSGEPGEEADLPGDGHVSVRYSSGVSLFVLRCPNESSDDAFYADSRSFIDRLLKAVMFSRPVGEQSIRVTSMGTATSDTVHTDRFGRKWQLRSWPIGYLDAEFLSLALPVPDGYVGILRMARSGEHDSAVNALMMLADYFQAPYSGTPSQWQAFMNRKSLVPPLFSSIELDFSDNMAVRYASPKFEVTVPALLLKPTESAVLTLDTVLLQEGTGAALDVGKFLLSLDDKEGTYVAAKRQIKPAATAPKEVQTRWDNMLNRRAEFAGSGKHDSSYKSFWVRSAVGLVLPGGALDRTAGVLYEISYRTDQKVMPRELEERRDALVQAFRILEH